MRPRKRLATATPTSKARRIAGVTIARSCSDSGTKATFSSARLAVGVAPGASKSVRSWRWTQVWGVVSTMSDESIDGTWSCSAKPS
nr:hypothetical protein [Deltaproteobacteria bacterium]